VTQELNPLAYFSDNVQLPRTAGQVITALRQIWNRVLAEMIENGYVDSVTLGTLTDT